MDTAGLEARARALAAAGGRRILGIAGAPGAGKSTLAAELVRALGPGLAVVVPMDGFHLAQAELERLGRADRKGAPDTFDAAGYVALLARLRERAAAAVYAPTFDRALEEPVAGSIRVGPHVPLVITEGNYLLHGAGAWAGV
ncbi:nucleoside/nucleotide kinase family protein, partial [Streptomyces sp. NPDC091259]